MGFSKFKGPTPYGDKVFFNRTQARQVQNTPGPRYVVTPDKHKLPTRHDEFVAKHGFTPAVGHVGAYSDYTPAAAISPPDIRGAASVLPGTSGRIGFPYSLPFKFCGTRNAWFTYDFPFDF